MLIKFAGYDVHMCKWPAGTFTTNSFFKFTLKETVLRVGLYEIEVCKINNETEVQEHASF